MGPLIIQMAYMACIRCVCSLDVCRCWKLGPDRLCRAGRWVPRQAMVKHASLDHCSLAALPSSSSSTASSLSILGPSGTFWQAGLHGVNVEIQEGSVHFGLSLRQNGCCGPFVHETRDNTWYEQIFGNFVGEMAEGPNIGRIRVGYWKCGELKKAWYWKHRKNCECCPGHYLSTIVY